MKHFRYIGFIFLLFTLSGCIIRHPIIDSEEKINSALFSSKENPSVSLVTVHSFNILTVHSALIINAKDVIIFDPAGTYKPVSASKYDVIYGASQNIIDGFIKHYRDITKRVIIQTVDVPAEVATDLYNAVHMRPVCPGFCTRTISSVLHKNKYFENIDVCTKPNSLRQRFAKLPHVKTVIY